MTGTLYISEDDGDILLIRTDSLGNKLWSKQYGELQWIEAGLSIAQLPDGQFLIGIERQSIHILTSADPGLLKVDSIGNLIWMKYYGGPFDEYGDAVALANDGNYLVSAAYAYREPGNEYPLSKAWIFKTDTAGYVIWDKKYGDTTFFGWNSTIDQLSDGNIIISGTGSFDDYPFPAFLGWILKTDANGDSIWMRRYSYFPYDNNEINDLKVTSDNGIIIAGQAYGYPDYIQSIWIQKLDIIGCDSIGCDSTIDLIDLKPNYISGYITLVYPNPAKDWITISFGQSLLSKNKDQMMEIFNVFGVRLDEVKIPFRTENFSYNTSALSNGIYLLVFRHNSEIIYSSKLLISK